MKITWKDILFFLIPGVLGYSLQALCPLRKAGKDVKFRPPAVAFGIIWAILFILFGLSWVIAVRESSHEIIPIITYSVATITLAAWIYVYGCANSSKGASWVLIFAVFHFSSRSRKSLYFVTRLRLWVRRQWRRQTRR